MDFDIAEQNGVTVVAPRGRLNMLAAPDLRKLLIESIDAGRAQIVIDLAGTEFIDSSGLGALVGGLKSTRAAGGDLRIARAPEQVATALKLTNLDRVLPIHTEVESAFHD